MHITNELLASVFADSSAFCGKEDVLHAQIYHRLLGAGYGSPWEIAAAGVEELAGVSWETESGTRRSLVTRSASTATASSAPLPQIPHDDDV